MKRSEWEDSNKGAWVIPGGHVDPGEDFEAAAKRELSEESGYSVDKCQNVGSYKDENVHIEYFQATIDSKNKPYSLQWEEVRDMKWIPIDEICEYDMIFNMKDNILNILGIEDKKEIIRKSDRKRELQDLLKKEIVKSEMKYQILKDKGLDDLDKGVRDEIEKAKKDISKLNKIKKLIYRDGKLIFGTYYVKTGETIEDEGKVSDTDKIKEDISEGEGIKVVTGRGKIIEGVVNGFSFNDKTKSHWVGIMTDSGEIEMVRLKSLKFYKKLDSKKEESEEVTDLSDLKVIRDLGGSSDVKLVESSGGFLYAMKKSHKGNNDQLIQEQIINDIYKSLGYDAPESAFLLDKEVLISNYIDGAKELRVLSGEDFESARKELKKGFVLDCLLGNWDVIGQAKDNILVKNGKVIRVDNGGCLETRARVGKKDFGSTCSEIDSMKEFNPGKEIFGDITEDEVKEQIEFLDKNKDKLKLPIDVKDSERLNKIILERLENLKSRFLSKKKEEKVERSKEVLRSDMPSLVTQRYFDNKYDSKMNISGNKTLKESIKKHILEVENYNYSDYSRLAKKLGKSVEELKEELQQLTEKVIEKSSGFIVAKSSAIGDSVVSKIIEGGRFKTQFETGDSCGCYSPSYRSEVENDYFGFDESKDDKSIRPVYGYFTDERNGVINSTGTIPPDRAVDNYGDICFKVKEEKFRKDATVTFIDSLGSESTFSASPVSCPHFTSIGNVDLDKYNTLKKLSEDRVSSSIKGYSYVETQYHGQLKVEDIESVHITSKQYNDNLSTLSNIINEINEATIKYGKLVPIKLF